VGKGVLQAVTNINEKIAPVVIGLDPVDLKAVDEVRVRNVMFLLSSFLFLFFSFLIFFHPHNIHI
jgi:hypothetical protein